MRWSLSVRSFRGDVSALPWSRSLPIVSLPIVSLSIFIALVIGFNLRAGEIVVSRAAGIDWEVYAVRQGNTEVLVAPAAGCNAYSIKVDGVQYFRQPP